MPEFGIKSDYGVFQYAGIIASVGLFEMFPSAAKLINDFESEQVIMYNLTLPVPAWIVILANISFLKLILLIVWASTFYASLIIWLSSIVKDICGFWEVFKSLG